MDSGAALRARAISALRSMRYWSTGAIVGYGVFLSSADACHVAPGTNICAKIVRATIRNIRLCIEPSLCGTSIQFPKRTFQFRSAVRSSIVYEEESQAPGPHLENRKPGAPRLVRSGVRRGGAEDLGTHHTQSAVVPDLRVSQLCGGFKFQWNNRQPVVRR